MPVNNHPPAAYKSKITCNSTDSSPVKMLSQIDKSRPILNVISPFEQIVLDTYQGLFIVITTKYFFFSSPHMASSTLQVTLPGRLMILLMMIKTVLKVRSFSHKLSVLIFDFDF